MGYIAKKNTDSRREIALSLYFFMYILLSERGMLKRNKKEKNGIEKSGIKFLHQILRGKFLHQILRSFPVFS